MTDCPDGTTPDTSTGCDNHLLPDPNNNPPPIHAPCSAAALDSCPTPTSTLFRSNMLPSGLPIAVVPATPPTWATGVTAQGDYVGLTDGTVRLVARGGATKVVAGRPSTHCASPTQPCGDGGPASSALIGTPNGLALGLDGSLYVADAALHRVRRIDPAGTITTVAGTGQSCENPSASCGDGGPATAAALGGPYGVWVDPSGDMFIADGGRGVREVLHDGDIKTVGLDSGGYDVRSVAGDASGTLYAATNRPDYLIQIDDQGRTTIVVGTGTSGYNGGVEGQLRDLHGTQVQINLPESLSIGLDGDVVFADSGNDLIRAYVPSTGAVINLAGEVNADGTPQGGYNGDGHWADQTLLDDPQAVTVTRGALYVVADTGNHPALRQIGPTPLSEQLAATPQPRSLRRTLITCHTATKKVPHKLGRTHHNTRVKQLRCKAARVTRAVTLRGSRRAQATLLRGGLVVATGTSVSPAPGRLRILVTRRRPLRPGRYALTLRRRLGRRWTVRRITITFA